MFSNYVILLENYLQRVAYIPLEIYDILSNKKDTYHYSALAFTVDSVVAQELFVVSHELGHIKAGHLNECKRKTVLIEEDESDFFVKSQEQEFEADIIGLKIFLDYVLKPQIFENKSCTKERDIILVSPLLLFSLLHLIEVNLGSKSHIYTHPKAVERLHRILDYYKENNILKDESWADEIKSLCESTPNFVLKLKDFDWSSL